MSKTSTFLTSLVLAATVALVYTAAAQDAPKQFTARELFYSAGDEPPAKPAAKPVKPTQTGTPAATRRPPSTQVATTPPDPTPKPVTKTVTATRVQSAAATAPDGSPIIRAAEGLPATAPAPASGPALGLKITVLKKSGNEDIEVAPDTVFHAGDRIRFNVQTNGPGYLYIVSQGSSGVWKPLFPSPDVENGDNHVDGFHSYAMPPKSRIVFDEQTGMEKVFIVFSREPEAEFENMIYSLSGSGQPATTPTSTRTSQPQAPSKPQKQMVVVANLKVPDSAIERMRQTYSRDLIIERVDENTAFAPGEKKEKAIYVVNPTGSTDPRVVADLQLMHQ